MKCLVVTAHPLQKSLCHRLTSLVIEKLEQQGHRVILEDLHKSRFQPVLSAKERETYYSESYDASAVSAYVKRLLEAEGLVLLFPTWWFSFPAILKGWFDRVWGPGITYDHADDYGPIKPRLNNLKQVLAITTLGASWWVDRLVMRQPVKKVIKTAILGACARNASFSYLSLYQCEALKADEIKGFENRIENALSGWK